MHAPHRQRRGILVVGVEEAFYELIHSFQPDRFALIFAAESSEAERRVAETLPDLIVLEAGSVLQKIPSYLSKARGKDAAVLALLATTKAMHDGEIPLALFDRVASLADRPGLVRAVRELLHERRGQPRINANLTAVVDGLHRGEVLDLSSNSLRVRTDAPLAPDHCVHISLDWGHQSVAALATVLSVSAQEPGVAVLRLDDIKATEVLERMVRKVLEIEHYRSNADDHADGSQGPVVWQLARRAERALRQTGSFRRVSAGEKDDSSADAGLSARYEVGRRLGRWGVGDVFHAEERLSGRPVLLKILRRELRQDAPARARLEMEARSASELTGLAEVVPVLDFGGDGEGGLYYAMQALDGERLATLLAAGQKFSERETARLGAHLADALAIARDHCHGHHDLCPENVFMERGPGGTWLPRLMGFAGELPSASAREIHAQGADYWPPEASECPADEPGDTYALCGMLRDVWSNTASNTALPVSADKARHRLHRLLWFGTADRPADRYKRLNLLNDALVQCSRSLDRSILGPPACIRAPGQLASQEALPAAQEPAEGPARSSGPGAPRQRLDTLQPTELVTRQRRQRSRLRKVSAVMTAAVACIAAVLFLLDSWQGIGPCGAGVSSRVGSAAAMATPLTPRPQTASPDSGRPLGRLGRFTDRPSPQPPQEPALPLTASAMGLQTPATQPAPVSRADSGRPSRSQRQRFYLRRALWYLDHSQPAGAQRNLTRALRYGDSHQLRKLISPASLRLAYPCDRY